MALRHAQTWIADAECRDADVQVFFALPPDDVTAATDICGRCAVRAPCFAYAVARPGIVGIWGGTTDAERSLFRRAFRT